MKPEIKANLINRMTQCWDSVEKLYDKILPMYRSVARSEHKHEGLQSVIKKTKKEITLMKTRASSITKLYNRVMKKDKDFFEEYDYNSFED